MSILETLNMLCKRYFILLTLKYKRGWSTCNNYSTFIKKIERFMETIEKNLGSIKSVE